MIPEAFFFFFVLPSGKDKILSVNASYVLKNVLFPISALSDSVSTKTHKYVRTHTEKQASRTVQKCLAA